MKILMLGGTGFVGGAVLSELCRAGHHVLALSRSEEADHRLKGAGAEVLRGDLRHPAQWAGSVQEVDAVVHAAATFTQDMGEVDSGVSREVQNQVPPEQYQSHSR